MRGFVILNFKGESVLSVVTFPDAPVSNDYVRGYAQCLCDHHGYKALVPYRPGQTTARRKIIRVM